MTDSVALILSRVRTGPSPYLAPHEARAVIPWLAAAVDGGDAWAMWIRGRIADSNLLPTDADLALALWRRGHELGSAACTFELAHRAERSRDLDGAALLYEQVADQHAPAAIRRGHVARDLALTATWRLRPAEIEALLQEAERWYRLGAQLGRGDAWEDVANAIRYRPGATPEDWVEWERCRARAAEAAAADRIARILDAIGGSDTPSVAPFELPTLLPWLASASQGGDTWAMWLHGRLADSGDAPGGQALALARWQSGSDLGDARCAFELAFRAEKKRKKEATQLHERSAAGGFGLAALRLGHLAKTWKEAEPWYRRAAGLGRVDAWIDMARLLGGGGKGAPVDPLEAARCWERAAEGGSPGAVDVVVEMYEEGAFLGQAIGRDPVKARRYAAEGMDLGAGGGSARCHFVMAKLLAAGEGGPVDREGAALWSGIAARRGDAVSERARALHAEVWGTLDGAARSRVTARDQELHPGLELA